MLRVNNCIFFLVSIITFLFIIVLIWIFRVLIIRCWMETRCIDPFEFVFEGFKSLLGIISIPLVLLPFLSSNLLEIFKLIRPDSIHDIPKLELDVIKLLSSLIFVQVGIL